MNIQEQRILSFGSATATTIAPTTITTINPMVQPAITLVLAIYALPVGTGLAEKALVGRHNEYRCVNRRERRNCGLRR
jgi:hypothetical protein